jgi:hypothetical protein
MAIQSHQDILKNMGMGRCGVLEVKTLTTTTITGAGSTSGLITSTMVANAIGTTYPGTLVSFPLGNLTSDHWVRLSTRLVTSTRAGWLANFYKIGTLVITATGDQFTHEAATFPILKTVLGQASQPLSLIPIVRVTTALTTTAAAFRLQTSGGAAGYTDQDGNSTVGDVTFTFPSATTAINSCYVLRLNSGDSAVRDISNIRIDTASAVGAADIWGVELIAPLLSQFTAAEEVVSDTIYGGMSLWPAQCGVATSGTATTFTGIYSTGATSAASDQVHLEVFTNP